MPVWDDVISDDEKRRYAAGGMGVSHIGFGDRPALLVVDMTYAFVESRFPLGYSATGRPAAATIAQLLGTFRAAGMPVFYTRLAWSDNPVERGMWKRSEEVNRSLQYPDAHRIVDEVKPRADEPVIVKMAPSAFFGTNLATMLTMKRVDTIVIVGMVTSGCVAASVVDAFSYGYRVIVPEDAVADRSDIAHKVTLFNIHTKYGDVVSTEKILAHLSSREVGGD